MRLVVLSHPTIATWEKRRIFFCQIKVRFVHSRSYPLVVLYSLLSASAMSGGKRTNERNGGKRRKDRPFTAPSPKRERERDPWVSSSLYGEKRFTTFVQLGAPLTNPKWSFFVVVVAVERSVSKPFDGQASFVGNK